MKIVLVGLGEVGGFYLDHWARAGHDLRYSFVRDQAGAAARAAGRAAYIEPEETGGWADVVLFAPRFEHLSDAADAIGDLGALVLIDPNNPFNPTRDGVVDLGGRTAAELLKERFPKARIVKAFHNLGVASIRAAERPLAAFIASDDAQAAAVAAELAFAAGLVPVETGRLVTARLSEFPGPLFGHAMSADEARAALAREVSFERGSA